MKEKAIILLSGGLDSTTCLAIASNLNLDCYALSFDYGQKQKAELEMAKLNAEKFHAKRHFIVNIQSLGELGGSALTDKNIDVPEYKDNGEIPITYVPARNTIFLSYALAYAEVVQARYIYIGASVVDYSGYPDCRPEFFEAYQNLINTSSKYVLDGHKLDITMPLLQLSKAKTIELGLKLGVDYSSTISCYQADANGKACGFCDSCTLRKQGFKDSGISDPTKYK
tara:strand:+ start:3686 stop:4363 length:678 start_codon:yes stop_codon:yes gene_type:complete